MDTSDILKTLLSTDSVKNISKKTGASTQDVTSVLTSALPAMLKGAQMQSEDKTSGFDKAVSEHATVSTGNLGAFMKGVDLSDGAKIVGHLLGSKTASTEKKTAEETGVSKEGVNDILSAASPLLMSLLGQKATDDSAGGNIKAQLLGSLVGSLLENVDISSLAGSLLGVGSNTEGNEKKKAESSGKKSDTAKKTSTTAKKTSSDTAKKTSTTAKKTSSDTAKKTVSTSKKTSTTDTAKKTASTTKKTSSTDTAKKTASTAKKTSSTDTAKKTASTTKKTSSTDTAKKTSTASKKEAEKEESGLDKLTGFITGLLK